MLATAVVAGAACLRPPFATSLPRAPTAELQAALRLDISRRCAELTLLGWLGRLYLGVPFVFERAFPSVLRLEPYDAACAACYRVDDESIEVTLKEGSVGGPKGIPMNLRLRTAAGGAITAATLCGIGCDLRGEAAMGREARGGRLDAATVRALCARIDADAPTKRLVVAALTRAVFGQVSAAKQAARRGVRLEACGDEAAFSPRQEVFGREGTSDKWLQQVAGYYFAESRLQDVRFAAAAEGTTFTFYLDPAEPLNSDDPTRIVNPEVINCVFGDT